MHNQDTEQFPVPHFVAWWWNLSLCRPEKSDPHLAARADSWKCKHQSSSRPALPSPFSQLILLFFILIELRTHCFPIHPWTALQTLRSTVHSSHIFGKPIFNDGKYSYFNVPLGLWLWKYSSIVQLLLHIRLQELGKKTAGIAHCFSIAEKWSYTNKALHFSLAT